MTHISGNCRHDHYFRVAVLPWQYCGRCARVLIDFFSQSSTFSPGEPWEYDRETSKIIYDPATDITVLDQLIGMGEAAEDSFSLIDYSVTYGEQIADADLSVVPIAVLIELPGEEPSPWIIDGWPQIIKARRQGTTSMPMFQITGTDERALRRRIWLGATAVG